MPALEGHEISELEESGEASRFDDPLTGERRASRMRMDIACRVEADFRRCGDERIDDDARQLSALFLIARSHMRRMKPLPARIISQ